MLQAKLAHKGFSRTTSGKMNCLNTKNHKLLDLDDFDVQMLSPQFLQAKTLKNPLKDLDIHLKKTNPNGTRFQTPHHDPTYFSQSYEEKTKSKFYQYPPDINKSQTPNYKYINTGQLNIQPAYKQIDVIEMPKKQFQLNLKDGNSIMSILRKKGQQEEAANMQINIKEVIIEKKGKKKGPAETKLQSLFRKEVKFNDQLQIPIKKNSKEIEEDIHEELNEQYENQSFDKMSGAYQSAIKQSIAGSQGYLKESIRESIAGGSDNFIKQSIRESIGSSGIIKESIKESIMRSSSMKQEIPEYLSGQKSSRQNIKQQIYESMNKSSIGEQIYDEDFQDASISDEIQKSRTSKFKKSKQEDKFDLSASQSKGFRTKTNNVVKSIKIAEDLIIKSQKDASNSKIKEKLEKGDKMIEEIMKEKASFHQLQNKISDILEPKKEKQKTKNKNLDLYYRFKIQVNRLIASETFSSKLRKLTSFMNINNSKLNEVNDLEDKILKDLMSKIEGIRSGQVHQKDMEAMKKQYDQKLSRMLKDQEIALKVEMDKKLHQKDLELKQMIAQLEQKFQSRGGYVASGREGQMEGRKFYGDKVEVDSDYSIDSEDVEWKMDLWELLPDYEKKKLYDRQGAEIANMLTNVIFKQIKQQSLNRSADISFEFPEEFNISSSFESNFPDFKRGKQKVREDTSVDSEFSFKSTFNREEIEKDLKTSSSKKKSEFPPLPGQQSRKPPVDIVIDINSSVKKDQSDNVKRDTTAVSEVIKILAKYKNIYLRKKNDTIRKILKTIQTKTKNNEPLISHLVELKILPDKQITEKDLPYVRAYEEEMIMELLGIYTKKQYRKHSYIEQEMRKMFDRLVITCQIKAAESSVKASTEIVLVQNYIDFKLKKEEKHVQDEVVEQIIKILAGEFAKEIPKRKK